MEVYGLSDQGPVRSKNEDVYKIVDEHNLFSIADGMGGHKAGEIAALTCINHVCSLLTKHLLLKDSSKNIEHIIYHINLAIQEANSKVFTMAKEDEKFKGMGTTLCMLKFLENTAIYAHVGDSRIYHYSDDTLNTLTKDHSLLNKLIDENKLDETRKNVKNIITKAIGTTPFVKPSIATITFKKEDLFIMSTDGLTDYVTDIEINQIINTYKKPKEIATNLLKKAQENSSSDNITIIVIKILK
jgi:protein phosphatase